MTDSVSRFDAAQDLQFMIAGEGVVHAEMPVHGPGLEDPFGLQLCVSRVTRFSFASSSSR